VKEQVFLKHILDFFFQFGHEAQLMQTNMRDAFRGQVTKHSIC